MIVFNELTQAFISKQSEMLVQIINEKKLSRYSIPKILVADLEKNKLGEYCFNRKLIILSRKLMYFKQETINHVLKHEYAHHCSMFQYGSKIQSHGKEFQVFCEILGISPKAKVNINEMDKNNNSTGDEEIILNKIKKLMSLSESENEHEAALALQKANDLILKHNIQYLKKNQKEVYQTVLYQAKTKSRKWSAISEIIVKITGVYRIWHKYGKSVYLEVNGDKESVQIADYLGSFLDREFERLYEKAKKEHNLKGKNAKNSYMMNLSSSFIDSLTKSVDSVHDNKVSKEMVLQEQEAFHSYIKSFVYSKSKIRVTSSYYNFDQKASLAGKNDASKLKIVDALNTKKETLLIEKK